jgi:hypothetical protein
MTAPPGVTGRKALGTSANLADDPLFSESETAKYLGISVFTLRRLRKRREIPFIQISEGRFAYRRSMANQIADARTVHPRIEAADKQTNRQ